MASHLAKARKRWCVHGLWPGPRAEQLAPLLSLPHALVLGKVGDGGDVLDAHVVAQDVEGPKVGLDAGDHRTDLRRLHDVGRHKPRPHAEFSRYRVGGRLAGGGGQQAVHHDV